MRRSGRPGLLGTMARTAVIAGTAQTVSGNVARRQAAAQQPAPAAQAAPAPEPAAGPPDLMAQLTRLGELRTAGLLDEAEFTAAKARLLGI